MKDLLILLFLAMIISGSLCSYYNSGCSEFEEFKKEICQEFEAGEDNKVCNLINGKCISTYRDCEDYKNDVKKDICESIIPYYYVKNKCVFSNNTCISKERTWSDFKFGLESNSNCELLKAEKENKQCVFINNKCEEHYKSCEYYEGNDEEKCKSIIPLYEDDPFFLHKCSFEKGKCVKKERLCEEYIENPEGFNYCHRLVSSDETKRCAYINNKCIEHYKNCKDYTGNDSKECESIEPFDETNEEPYFNKKCVFEEGKCIRKEKTSCSEYKPGYNDEDACSMIQLKDENKVCVLLAEECVETYKTCENYKGDNEDICKSIIPTFEKEGSYVIDNELKCSLINNKCVQTERYCSEYIFTGGKFCDGLKIKNVLIIKENALKAMNLVKIIIKMWIKKHAKIL